MRGQIEAAWGGEKAGEVPLLIVTGLEDAAERERACAQLNVERDELARDFAIPWVLIQQWPDGYHRGSIDKGIPAIASMMWSKIAD